jgi:hypothetical protein
MQQFGSEEALLTAIQQMTSRKKVKMLEFRSWEDFEISQGQNFGDFA